jgi:hypothetical protein
MILKINSKFIDENGWKQSFNFTIILPTVNCVRTTNTFIDDYVFYFVLEHKIVQHGFPQTSIFSNISIREITSAKKHLINAFLGFAL